MPPTHPAYQLGEYYFREAQRRLGVLTCENSLVAAQCGFFTGVYLMYTLRILAAWKAFINAGTQCLGYFASKRLIDITSYPSAPDETFRHISNHQDGPSTSNSRALEDALYWSCLKSEV